MIMKAYEGLIDKKLSHIFLLLCHHKLDVNVHPSKLKLNFKMSSDHATLNSLAKKALELVD